MTQCKNQTCQNEVVSVPGRRPKEFCSPECRTKFHNSKNAKGTGRGRPKGSKNKSKEQTPPIEENKFEVEKRPCGDCKNIQKDANGYFCPKLLMAVIPSLLVTYEISKGSCFEEKLEDEIGVKKYDGITMHTEGTKEQVADAVKEATEIGLIKYDGKEFNKEALDELAMFGTVTVKTELVDGEVKQSVVDKKKIVNEEKEWKPKLSPFMQERQKKKEGLK